MSWTQTLLLCLRSLTGSLKFVFALTFLFAACTSTRQLTYPARYSGPIECAFASFDSTATTARVTLSFRSENMRGRVRGKITRAAHDAYRIELSERGELLLKTYVTSAMTIVWPDGASPVVLEERESAMLSELVPGLPDWPLRACLPVLFPQERTACDSLQQVEIPRSAEVVHHSEPNHRLVVKFSKRSSSLNFPYERIVVEEPGQRGRLVWKIIP